MTEDFVANDLIVVADKEVSFHFPKYHTPFERKHERIRYTRADWSRLYRERCERPTAAGERERAFVPPRGVYPSRPVNPNAVAWNAAPKTDVPAISVIVPMYNVSDVVGDCIRSLATQTLAAFEVLLVDDRSTDATIATARTACEGDARFVVHEPSEKLFAGATRNYGLARARGEFLIFVDADDFLDPRMLERLYEKAIAEKADAVICHFDIYQNDTKEFVCADSSRHLEGRDFSRGFSLINYPQALLSTHVNYNKLFRRETLTRFEIVNPTYKFYDDFLFHWQALTAAARVAIVPETLYHWRRNRPGTITSDWSRVDLSQVGRDLLRSCEDLLVFFDRNGIGDAYLPELRKSLVRICILESAMHRGPHGAAFFASTAAAVALVDARSSRLGQSRLTLAERVVWNCLRARSYSAFRAMYRAYVSAATAKRICTDTVNFRGDRIARA